MNAAAIISDDDDNYYCTVIIIMITNSSFSWEILAKCDLLVDSAGEGKICEV